MGKGKLRWQRPVLLAAAGATQDGKLRSAIKWALVTIDAQQAENARLTRELSEKTGALETTRSAIACLDAVGRESLEQREEIERLTRERDAAMAIEYAAREWAAGRLTDEGLREQLAA